VSDVVEDAARPTDVLITQYVHVLFSLLPLGDVGALAWDVVLALPTNDLYYSYVLNLEKEENEREKNKKKT
jgi:hypothetical protein